MRNRVLACVAAAFLGLGLASAQAQTQKQINVLNNIAGATAAAELCPKIQTNEALIAAALAVYKVDLSQRKFNNLLQQKVEEQIQALRKFDTDIVCVSGLFLYGPEGQNVPGLLSKR